MPPRKAARFTSVVNGHIFDESMSLPLANLPDRRRTSVVHRSEPTGQSPETREMRRC